MQNDTGRSGRGPDWEAARDALAADFSRHAAAVRALPAGARARQVLFAARLAPCTRLAQDKARFDVLNGFFRRLGFRRDGSNGLPANRVDIYAGAFADLEAAAGRIAAIGRRSPGAGAILQVKGIGPAAEMRERPDEDARWHAAVHVLDADSVDSVAAWIAACGAKATHVHEYSSGKSATISFDGGPAAARAVASHVLVRLVEPQAHLTISAASG